MHEHGRLYFSLRLADRFKWTLSYIKELTTAEFTACVEYINKHPADPTLHRLILQNTAITASCAGAKLPKDFYKEYQDSWVMPTELCTPEEIKERILKRAEMNRANALAAGCIVEESKETRKRRKQKTE